MKLLFVKIKYRLSLIKLKLFLSFGLEKFLLKNRYGERILIFHGIDTVGEIKYNSRFVSEAYFEKIIHYISNHYNVISIEDYYAKKFKKHTLNIAITFDDGYLNNLKYAIPILEKYQVPASFYITTIHQKNDFLWADFLDLVSFHSSKKEVVFETNLYKKNIKGEFIFNNKSLKSRCIESDFKNITPLFEIFKEDWNAIKKQSLDDYWRLMNAEQIKKINDNPLFTIGAHGNTHANLSKISLNEAKSELFQNKQILETICKTPIFEFAFPFGFYTKKTIDYCKEIGFTKVLLVSYQNEKDKNNHSLKNRFGINPYISLKEQLVFLLRGSYF